MKGLLPGFDWVDKHLPENLDELNEIFPGNGIKPGMSTVIFISCLFGYAKTQINWDEFPCYEICPGEMGKAFPLVFRKIAGETQYGAIDATFNDGPQMEAFFEKMRFERLSYHAMTCDLIADIVEDASITAKPKATESATTQDPITCNPDCTFVEWGDIKASLRDVQAACFMVLWNAWKTGSQPLSSKHIWIEAPKLFLDNAGRHINLGYKVSLSSVFRSNNTPHPFWNTLITSPQPGFYELSLPKPAAVHV